MLNIDQAMGMFVGLAIGDALGAPLDDLDDVGVVRVRDGLPLDPVRLCEVGW